MLILCNCFVVVGVLLFNLFGYVM